jgi:hypothetical protein
MLSELQSRILWRRGGAGDSLKGRYLDLHAGNM